MELQDIIHEIDFLNETLFVYNELFGNIKIEVINGDLFLNNAAQQYRHSMIMCVCRARGHFRTFLNSVNDNIGKFTDSSKTIIPKNNIEWGNDKTDEERVQFLNEVFRKLNQKKYIIPSEIQSDIEIFNGEMFKPIVAIRDKIVAHIDSESRDATFGLLDLQLITNAFELMLKMVQKYAKTFGMNYMPTNYASYKDLLKNNGVCKIFQCVSNELR